MNRFHETIGFAQFKETAPGVHTEVIEERNYSGDVLQVISKWRDAETANQNLTTQNRFSFLSDPYAEQNYARMRYLTWMGERWKIVSAEVKRPRIIIAIGEVYNEQTNPITDSPGGDPGI